MTRQKEQFESLLVALRSRKADKWQRAVGACQCRLLRSPDNEAWRCLRWLTLAPLLRHRCIWSLRVCLALGKWKEAESSPGPAAQFPGAQLSLYVGRHILVLLLSPTTLPSMSVCHQILSTSQMCTSLLRHHRSKQSAGPAWPVVVATQLTCFTPFSLNYKSDHSLLRILQSFPLLSHGNCLSGLAICNQLALTFPFSVRSKERL